MHLRKMKWQNIDLSDPKYLIIAQESPQNLSWEHFGYACLAGNLIMMSYQFQAIEP